MNKRIIIKTALICFGVFLLISAVLIWIFSEKFEIDREKRIQVVVAKMPIQQGTVINREMIGIKTIRESSFNSHMLTDAGEVIGTKAAAQIGQEDYIRTYVLLSKDKWYKEDERIIVLPMEVEERLANLIRKGSYIDIKLAPKEVKAVPKLVLSRVRVEDVLDENGVSLGSNGAAKKAYARVVLDNRQRDRIYVAREMGKLIFELYCDTTQGSAEEEFQIPEGYMERVQAKLK